MRPTPRTTLGACASAAVFLVANLAAPVCSADLLQFEFSPDLPIIQSINGTLRYDEATGNFHSETIPLTYNSPLLPDFVFFSSGLTTIDLFVNHSGRFVASGTGFTMTGALDFDGDGIDDVSGDALDPLLFGRVTAFGAEDPGPPTRAFNGLFDIEGGQLTETIALSGGGTFFGGFPVGHVGGFFLFAENVTEGTLGDFTASFASDSVKDTVGVVVPEPATCTLGLIGVGAMAVAGLRNRKHSRPG